MAHLGGTFNANDVEERKGFEALEPGEYSAMVIKSGFEPTGDGLGQFLKLEIEVIDGPRKGAILFERLNLMNNSEIAVKIARETLGEICRATDRLSVDDSEELHGKAMTIKVAKVPRTTGKGKDRVAVPGEWSNEIKSYKKPGAGGGTSTVATGGGAAAAGGRPSWMGAKS